MFREGVFDHTRRDNVSGIAAGGTPIAVVAFGPASEGYCWYLENVGWSVVGNSHNALLDLAVTPDQLNVSPPAQAAWDHAGLVDTFTTAAVRGSRNYPSALKIPAGHFLIAYFAGGSIAAGDAVTLSLQVAVHELNPRYLMSPEDQERVRREHENEPAPHAAVVGLPAVSGERAV